MKFEFVNRDISWLHFNYRVLEEAKNQQLPIYERIKFLAIYSNNLNEFYRVRVSYYRRLLLDFPKTHEKIQKVKPARVVETINRMVGEFQDELMHVFHHDIIPSLARNNVIIIQDDYAMSHAQNNYIHKVFRTDILPYLQPVILQKNKIKPFLRNGQIYIVLKMQATGSKKLSYVYGLVKLPTDHNVARFIELPADEQGKHCIMFLEDIMIKHLHELYVGYEILSWHSIKMTRNADFDYEEYESNELIDIISTISSTRQLGFINRFQYDSTMPAQTLSYVLKSLDVSEHDGVKSGKYHNFSDFFQLPNPVSPLLEHPRFIQLLHPALEKARSLIKHIESNDCLLHFPYQSFNYFLHYLQEAAHDKSVTEIKITQYRVAYNSAVVKSLIQAAQNGKQVTVFVELKARFDEENNLRFAKEMKQAGIHIMYSIPGLKVHAKMACIVRLTTKGKRKVSAFLSTGNFNENTATIYCDQGYFTGRPEITQEVEALFALLEENIKSYNFKHILVPNNNMVETYTQLIKEEIAAAEQGRKTHIILKMNALEAPYLIKQLYKASVAGVRIDIIVRGACCLKTQQSYSQNIRAIRIVDRFLEHDRVFYFYNNGHRKIYVGSADWMRRNLYKRIECVFPIYDEYIKQELLDLLYIQIADNTKARLIGAKSQNVRIEATNKAAIQSQQEIYSYLQNKYYGGEPIR